MSPERSPGKQSRRVPAPNFRAAEGPALLKHLWVGTAHQSFDHTPRTGVYDNVG